MIAGNFGQVRLFLVDMVKRDMLQLLLDMVLVLGIKKPAGHKLLPNQVFLNGYCYFKPCDQMQIKGKELFCPDAHKAFRQFGNADLNSS